MQTRSSTLSWQQQSDANLHASSEARAKSGEVRESYMVHTYGTDGTGGIGTGDTCGTGIGGTCGTGGGKE